MNRYCAFCFDSTHTREEHQCSLCGKLGHSEFKHSCFYCDGNHTSTDHVCNKCNKKGHDASCCTTVNDVKN